VNRLADSTSPYLRQHADNPVEWLPWGDEAFARARERDVPIFLSVGYSSCHWCHVMAHESFEDAETAALMNRLFVNVKVDREERPDVDAVYMQAVQTLTGRGGWPMSVWLDADGRPFYAGTYFPASDGHGMPSFRRVCAAVAEAWHDRRDDVAAQSEQLTAALTEEIPASAGGPVTTELLAEAYANVKAAFEPHFGGFGHAPKFPAAMTIAFLCRAHARSGAADTLEMITTTLDHMAAGGIHDQVGGGFARYSTDEQWTVPHFEKMLYDNALLTRAYLQGYLTTGDPRYRAVVDDIVGYVLRDLRHGDGAFLSAEDADSEGVEGKFYCWSIDEIREVAGADADAVIAWYGVTAEGNFADPHTGFRGNVLRSVDPGAAAPPVVEAVRARLFERRTRRVRPGLDDKVLLEWNALMVAALAEAGAALGRSDWIDAARAATAFVLRELRRDDGRLLRSWRSPHLAFATDYAALLEALCTMAEADDVAWLDDARWVGDELIRLFHDPDGRGFFTVGRDAEQLVVRAKDWFDNATPSANSLAANGLLRLAALTGETRYEAPAVEVVEMLARPMAHRPTGFAHLLAAAERIVGPPVEIAIVGPPGDPRTEALRREVTTRLVPGAVSVCGPPDARTPLLRGRELAGGVPTAYVCERYACRAPVTDPEALGAQLDAVIRGD